MKAIDMRVLVKLLVAGLLACSCSCNKNTPEGGEGGDGRQDDPVEVPSDAFAYVTSDEYQTIDGFGAALTVSSCYNLLKMDESGRTAFLRQMFDPETGAGSSLIRVCIGGSDFSWDYGESGLSSDGRFTWCDTEGMSNFAPHPMDVRYVVPVLKEIYAINPAVKVIGSPCSP